MINRLPHCAACRTDFATVAEFREHLDECRRNDPPRLMSPTAQAHRDAGETETAARDRVAPIAGKLRAQVLWLVADAGPAGLTATEAYDLYVAIFGERRGGLYSLAPRLSELERQGYVSKGATRDDRASYVATDAGIAWAESEAA